VFLAGLTLTLTRVDLGLHDPPAQRLRTDAFLTGDRRNRLRVRRVLGPVLEDEPHGSLTHLGIDLLRHDAILPTRKDAASNPGRFNPNT
jgi:hypothetical protein